MAVHWPWEHDWHLIGFRPGENEWQTKDVTRFLYQCPCGKVKVQTVDGIWRHPDPEEDLRIRRLMGRIDRGELDEPRSVGTATAEGTGS